MLKSNGFFSEVFLDVKELRRGRGGIGPCLSNTGGQKYVSGLRKQVNIFVRRGRQGDLKNRELMGKGGGANVSEQPPPP
jgi:hypothetical protein